MKLQISSVIVAITTLLGAGPVVALAAPAPVPKAVIGVALPSYHYDPSALTSWEKSTGHKAALLQTFISWDYPGSPSLSDFPTSRAKQFSDLGTTLEISWDPASSGNASTNQPAYRLGSIAAGKYDSYIRRFASEVKAFGRPVVIRFAHEMNGKFTSYNESNSGNKAGDFVRAYRHVHDVFGSTGVKNVKWVWSVNIESAGETPLPGLYPGDAYVDEIGIDGYSYPRAGCASPSALFEPTLKAISAITKKPVQISEVGVSAACPGRSSWVSKFVSYVQSRPKITGFSWWERSDSANDFRIVPSSTLPAFKEAIKNYAP